MLAFAVEKWEIASISTGTALLETVHSISIGARYDDSCGQISDADSYPEANEGGGTYSTRYYTNENGAL